MRNARIAERILSLVLPRERASAIAGDLIEEADHRGAVWFWATVFRTLAAFVVRGVDWSVFSMGMAAAFSWLIYIPVSIVAVPIFSLFLTVVFGFAYFLTHHSLVELAIRIPLLRFDWPVMPWVTEWAAVFIMAAWAPWQVGRFVASGRPGRELLAGIVAAVVWPLAAQVLPLHGPTRAGIWVLPLILSCVIAGALDERRRSMSAQTLQPSSD